jgi:hypothetical protein
MAEIVFIVATAVALVALFRHVAIREPNLRTWLAVAAVVLIALPGVITLISLTAPFMASDPFGADRTVLVPTPEARRHAAPELLKARGFLVQGFHVIEGNEGQPVGFLERVLPPARRTAFDLVDGSRLTIWITSVKRPGPSKGSLERCPALGFRWAGSGEGRSGEAIITRATDGRDDPGGENRWMVRIEDLRPDMAAFGSLLADTYRRGRIHFLIEPLGDPEAVTALPANTWWEKHGANVVARIQRGMESEQETTSKGSTSSFSVGPVITVSGFLMLLAAGLLILMSSAHWVRTLCFLILYCTLYAGTVDRLVLRIHSAGLSVGRPESRAAAAVETACTRLHPVTAARGLLAAALEDPEPAVRVTALRCLERDRFVMALSRIDGSRRRIEGLTHAPDLDLGQTATRLLEWRDSDGNPVWPR